MIYRVIFSVGYNTAWFEFETIEGAGEFAKEILTRQVANEDTNKKTSVRIDVIDLNAKEKEDE